VCDDADVRVDRAEPRRRRIDLLAADVGRAVEKLTVEVAFVDAVEVHEIERADARRRQIHRRR
jgi:hypothetical protein